MDGIKELVEKSAEENDRSIVQNIAKILNSCCPLIVDDQTQVRNAFLSLFSTMLRTFESKIITPHTGLIVMYICSGMTHLIFSIRLTALDLLDILLQSHPHLLANYIGYLLPNYINLLSLPCRSMGSSAAATAPSNTHGGAGSNNNHHQHKANTKNILSSSVQIRIRLLSSFLRFLKFAIHHYDLRKPFGFISSKKHSSSSFSSSSSSSVHDKLSTNMKNDHEGINNNTEIEWKMEETSIDSSSTSDLRDSQNNLLVRSFLHCNREQPILTSSSLLITNAPKVQQMSRSSLSPSDDSMHVDDSSSSQPSSSSFDSQIHNFRKLETLNDVEQLAIELTPQLVEHWLECSPGDYPNSSENLIALQIILDLFILLIGSTSKPTSHSTSYTSFMHSHLLPLLQKHVIVYFPFVSRSIIPPPSSSAEQPEKSHNTIDPAQKINESISVVMTSFLTPHNFLRDEWSVSVLDFLERSIEKKRLTTNMYIVFYHFATMQPIITNESDDISSLRQRKNDLFNHFTDLVKQINSVESMAKENAASFIIDLLQSQLATSFTNLMRFNFKRSTTVRSSFHTSNEHPNHDDNQTIITEDISMDNNDDGSVEFDQYDAMAEVSTSTEVIEEWFSVLSKYVWQLGDKNLEITKNVITCFLRFAVFSSVNESCAAIYDNFQYKLIPYFSVNFKGKLTFGPFSKLPLYLQQKTVELLYYFRTFSPALLLSVAQCCSMIDERSIVYILETISHRSGSIAPLNFGHFLTNALLHSMENKKHPICINRIFSEIQNIILRVQDDSSSVMDVFLSSFQEKSNENQKHILRQQFV